MISKEAREWGERIVSRHDLNNWPEQYRTKAEWDHEVRRAGLVADEMLDALRKIENLDVEDATALFRSEALLTVIDRLQDVARAAIAKAEGRTE